MESYGRLLPAEIWHWKKGCMEDHIHLLKTHSIEKKKKEMYGKLTLQQICMLPVEIFFLLKKFPEVQ